jgi:hypothetical protein
LFARQASGYFARVPQAPLLLAFSFDVAILILTHFRNRMKLPPSAEFPVA